MSNSKSLLKGWVTEIIIDAPKQFVWDRLVDFESYKDWNPFILEASAEFKVGSRIRCLEAASLAARHPLRMKETLLIKISQP